MRNFGEGLSMVAFEMKNLESLPFEITSALFGPRAVMREGHVKADAPGPQIREAILRGYEAISKDYIETLKNPHNEDWSPEEREQKLQDFEHRVLPEVRRKLVWKKAR